MKISTSRTLSTQEMDRGHPRQGMGRQGTDEGLSRPLCPCVPPRPRLSYSKQVPPELGGERQACMKRRKLPRKLAASQLLLEPTTTFTRQPAPQDKNNLTLSALLCRGKEEHAV